MLPVIQNSGFWKSLKICSVVKAITRMAVSLCAMPYKIAIQSMYNRKSFIVAILCSLLCSILSPCFSFYTESTTAPSLNIKTVFPRQGDSHAKDKTVARPSYL